MQLKADETLNTMFIVPKVLRIQIVGPRSTKLLYGRCLAGVATNNKRAKLYNPP